MPYKDPIKQREAQRRYYKENKDYYREYSRIKRNLIRREIIRLKGLAPCADCRISYPHYIMDFDHVRGKKRFSISSQVSDMTMATFKEEVNKCEVVCANCHRHRTFIRNSKNKNES